MHPIYDADAFILLAMALSSKRRPAELVEIIAAADLLQQAIPSESKLVEAFDRLSTHGLISEVDGRFTLTPDAQKIMANLPQKADTAERVFGIREKLSAYNPEGEHASIALAAEQVSAAVLEYQGSKNIAGKNLLVPKPKAPEGSHKRAGPWRKPMAGRGRKT